MSETGKRIPVVHSGAFAKFVGRLDVVVRDGEVLSHKYKLIPVDSYTVPAEQESPIINDILEEYAEEIEMNYNTDQVIAQANVKLTRYGSTGGDSMLGNFASDAIRFYPGVETEIALTNTLGIRADIPPGEITIDDLFNSMPFDNTITTMFLSGREVQELWTMSPCVQLNEVVKVKRKLQGSSSRWTAIQTMPTPETSSSTVYHWI